MIETSRMIANIIGHLRLCYQLVRFWVVSEKCVEGAIFYFLMSR
jgi:hypothetical protein